MVCFLYFALARTAFALGSDLRRLDAGSGGVLLLLLLLIVRGPIPNDSTAHGCITCLGCLLGEKAALLSETSEHKGPKATLYEIIT